MKLGCRSSAVRPTFRVTSELSNYTTFVRSILCSFWLQEQGQQGPGHGLLDVQTTTTAVTVDKQGFSFKRLFHAVLLYTNETFRLKTSSRSHVEHGFVRTEFLLTRKKITQLLLSLPYTESQCWTQLSKSLYKAVLRLTHVLYQKLPSSGLLRSVRWLDTDVSGIHTLLPGQLDPWSWDRQVVPKLPNHLTPRNNPEDGRIHFNRARSVKSRKSCISNIHIVSMLTLKLKHFKYLLTARVT